MAEVLKGVENVFYLSEYISDIYTDGLCVINAKNLIMKSHDFVHSDLFTAR